MSSYSDALKQLAVLTGKAAQLVADRGAKASSAADANKRANAAVADFARSYISELTAPTPGGGFAVKPEIASEIQAAIPKAYHQKFADVVAMAQEKAAASAVGAIPEGSVDPSGWARVTTAQKSRNLRPREGDVDSWGIPRSQRTVKDYLDFAEKHEVDIGKGPSTLVPIESGGSSWQVPSSFLDDSAAPSLFDLARSATLGWNPAQMDPDLQVRLMKALSRAYAPNAGQGLPALYGQMFAALSPAGEFSKNMASYLAARPSKGGLSKWAEAAGLPEEYFSSMATGPLGLQSGAFGGIGANDTGVPRGLRTMAAQISRYMDDPGYFVARPGESQTDLLERLSNTIPGTSFKMNSFGTYPATVTNPAGIMAGDIHVARRYADDIMRMAHKDTSFPELRNMFNNQFLNQGKFKGDKSIAKVTSWDSLEGHPLYGDFRDWVVENRLMSHPDKVKMLASGERNPAVSELLFSNPDTGTKVQTMSPIYSGLNDIIAAQGRELGLTPQEMQWMGWQHQRERFEPHQIYYPGLEKLPPMTLPDVLDFWQYMKAASPMGRTSSGGKPAPRALSGDDYLHLMPMAEGGVVNADAKQRSIIDAFEEALRHAA